MSREEKNRIRSSLWEEGEASVKFPDGGSWHMVYEDATREVEISADINGHDEFFGYAGSLIELFEMIEEREEIS